MKHYSVRNGKSCEAEMISICESAGAGEGPVCMD